MSQTVENVGPAPIEHPGEDRSNDIRRRLAAVEPHCLRTYTPTLAVLAKSAGCYHWTPEGRKLADFTSGVLVTNLGHNPTRWWRNVLAYLGLDVAGIAVDARQNIVVDNELRTNVAGIWALGDCNGKGGFTHTSYNDFEIVASNVLDLLTFTVAYRAPSRAALDATILRSIVSWPRVRMPPPSPLPASPLRNSRSRSVTLPVAAMRTTRPARSASSTVREPGIGVAQLPGV